MKLPEEALAQGARPLWLPYVQVPNVDASNDQAVGLGAKSLVAPADIPAIGRFAMLADPQGATFAIFKPEGDTPGHDGPPKPGQFSWHELATTDYEAALGFYSELFGWTKVETMDMGEAGIYQMYGRGGGAPRWHVQQESGNAGTADVDALCERAERRRARRHDQGKRGTSISGLYHPYWDQRRWVFEARSRRESEVDAHSSTTARNDEIASNAHRPEGLRRNGIVFGVIGFSQ